MTEIVMSMMATPKIILVSEIITIGLESLFLSLPPLIILFAMNNSVFKITTFTCKCKIKIMIKFNSILFILFILSCAASNQNEVNNAPVNSEIATKQDEIKGSNALFCNDEVKVGAERTELYFEQLKGLRVGVIGNQSSTINGVHLVDSLIGSGIKVVKVFSPEHGFRGTADAGEKVNNEFDSKTGLPLVSLYGKNK